MFIAANLIITKNQIKTAFAMVRLLLFEESDQLVW